VMICAANPAPPANRALLSSTFWLNVITFCGIRRVLSVFH
jgi:hypothetical protein